MPLEYLVIESLKWLGEKAADAIITDPLKDQVKKFAEGREPRKELEQAIEKALALTREQFPFFDAEIDLDRLIPLVVTFAFLPPLLANPDYDQLLTSWKISGDPKLARQVLEFFFPRFRHEWELQPAFGALRGAYEAHLTRLGIEQLTKTEVAYYSAILDRLQFGLPVYWAKPQCPPGSLIRVYLEAVAAQRQRDYLDRMILPVRASLPETLVRGDPNAQRPETSSQPRPLDSVVQDRKKVVLLGEPGMGKTAALRHLESAIAARVLARMIGTIIPIYIELRHYDGSAEWELEAPFARRVNELLRVSKHMLSPDPAEATRIMRVWLSDSDSHFLLLLDGLNEVRPEFHEKVRAALQALLNYPHSCIVSCRMREYDQSFHDRSVDYTLQPLGPEEISSYLQQKLGEYGNKLFREQLKFDTRMLGLASNPLLLELIISITQGKQEAVAPGADPDICLPANRGRLFQQFAREMPRRKATEGFRPEAPPALVMRALYKLGFELHRRGSLTADLAEIQDWGVSGGSHPLEQLLGAAKQWRFLNSDGQQPDEPNVEFLHPLFAEYFAAEWLTSQLRTDRNFDEVLGDFALEPKWRESMVMLAGIFSKPVELIKWLAARVVTEQKACDISTTSWEAAPTPVRRFWLFPYLGPSDVSLLTECWSKSDASTSAEAYEVVLQALMEVVRIPHRGALDFLASKILKERVAAARVLGQSSDKRALAALDWVSKESPGEHPFWKRLFSADEYFYFTVSQALKQVRQRIHPERELSLLGIPEQIEEWIKLFSESE